jgi:hypothetical protein
MLCAIDLDDQPRFEADKVQNVTIYWNLPLEFESFKLTTPESLPKHILSLGGITAHGSGELSMSIRNVAKQEFSRFLIPTAKSMQPDRFLASRELRTNTLRHPQWPMRQFSYPSAIAEHHSQL